MNNFWAELRQGKKYLVLTGLVFAGALLIGFFAKAWLSVDKITYLEQYIKLILENLTASKLPDATGSVDTFIFSSGLEFRKIFSSNLVFLALWWACGLWVFGYIPAYILLASRGFLLGLVLSLLLGSDLAYGLLILLILLLPANLVLLPAYFGSTIVAAAYSKEILLGSGGYLKKLPYYTLLFGIFVLLILLGSWLQGVATPFLLQAFMGLI